jgi:molybdopterin-containing oxidoreductase family iron-sulfur binding subunit
MKITRKDFLRLTGFSFLAIGSIRAIRAISSYATSSLVGSGTKPIRWGMVIDFKKCKTDCNQCIAACNQAHNIPKITDSAHEIKWIWEQPFKDVFPASATNYGQPDLVSMRVPLMCNHCGNPPCTRVCPTRATWKRDDGIVMMDWHRCIGCRYCVAACPYGSRSFNWQNPRLAIASINQDFPTRTKGVVEKCNFCEERLARGESPACVEACPEKAFIFGNLADPDSEPRRILRSRFAIQREPELGTGPSVYYLV